jgi:tetratricopeptide (TPR) repeat protein
MTLRHGRFLFMLLLLAPEVWPAADSCRELRHHGKRAEAQSCFTNLLNDHDPLARAQGLWGLGRFNDANVEFRAAEKSHPNSAVVKTEWGDLFLERYQPGDAAKLFTEAVEADAKYARAYLGMARVAARGYDKKAVDFAKQALERDPKLYEARELTAYLALEDSDPKAAAEEAQKAIAISGDALDAMAVLASADWLSGKTESEWLDRVFKVNPVYGAAYETGAHFFEITGGMKRRSRITGKPWRSIQSYGARGRN